MRADGLGHLKNLQNPNGNYLLTSGAHDYKFLMFILQR